MNLICYHECGVEAKSEVTDDLIVVCFVFVFFNEICCAGKCDLVDVFLNLVCGHTKTIIDKF